MEPYGHSYRVHAKWGSQMQSERSKCLLSSVYHILDFLVLVNFMYYYDTREQIMVSVTGIVCYMPCYNTNCGLYVFV